MPNTGFPVVITSNDRTLCDYPLIETDCACPVQDERSSLTHSQIENVSYRSVPTLYIERLSNSFCAAFDPNGCIDVAVLNQPAKDLLNVFSHPISLENGVRLAGNPVSGLHVVQRLAQLGLLEPVGIEPTPRPTQSQTLTAWLHITNDCNLDCPYCYVHKSPDRMSLEQGRRSVEAVFRSAVANGFRRVKLKYAGGEATLNFPLVLALHDYAEELAAKHELELLGVVLSNGVAIGSRAIEEMKVRGIRLMISLDGVHGSHDTQRSFVNGRGSFTHVERTLDRLAAHDFIPSISITLSRRNLDGLPAVVDYVLQRDLPFTLNFYRENDCSASFADLAYGDEKVIAAMKAAFAVTEANLPPYSLMDRLLDLTRLDAPHDRTCGVGHSYMVINHRGGVAKCHMELERTITDVSVMDPLRLIRVDQTGIQNLPVREKEGCKDCTWRNRCAGGCPALTYRVTGRYDVKSPNCRIYKALFPEVLRLEGLRLLKYGLSQIESRAM